MIFYLQGVWSGEKCHFLSAVPAELPPSVPITHVNATFYLLKRDPSFHEQHLLLDVRRITYEKKGAPVIKKCCKLWLFQALSVSKVRKV